MTDILRLSLPLTVWLIGFCAVYGLQGVVCASFAWYPSGAPGWGNVTWVAAGTAIIVQAGVLWLVWRQRSRIHPGLRRETLVVAAAAMFAAVWTTLPAVLARMFTPC